MSCVRDIIAISGQAVRAHIAYKDAPDGYRHISEHIAALQVLIDKVAQLLKGTTISSDDRLDGQKILKGCQSVLQDLSSLIEKYNRLVLINRRLVLKGVKLGKEDITALQIRLISQTGLLNGFIRRFVVPVMYSTFINSKNINFYSSCEYNEVQAQLTDIFGLHGANSRTSVSAIASFAADTDIDTAYNQLCKDLDRDGVTEDVIQIGRAHV